MLVLVFAVVLCWIRKKLCQCQLPRCWRKPVAALTDDCGGCDFGHLGWFLFATLCGLLLLRTSVALWLLEKLCVGTKKRDVMPFFIRFLIYSSQAPRGRKKGTQGTLGQLDSAPETIAFNLYQLLRYSLAHNGNVSY
mmetsp:Transcript_26205/g.54706  ORF Transcript_26205/g.54706 Transcript_26205/m.54706 type:complete len:137 (-) Transcript_26205:252-662(-)